MRGFFSQVGLYGAARMMQQGIDVLAFVLYAKLLAPADFGIIALCAGVSGVLAVFYQLGLTTVVTIRYYKDEPATVRRLSGSVVLFGALWGFTLSVVLTVVGPVIFPHVLSSVSFYPYVTLAIWTAFFSTFSAFPEALLQLQKRPAAYAFVTVGERLLQFLCIALGVWWMSGARGYLTGQLLSQALILGVYAPITLSAIRLTVRREDVREALRLGLPLIPHQFALRATGVVDRFVLGRYVPLADVGSYSVGMRLGGIVSMFTSSYQQAYAVAVYQDGRSEAGMPRLSRLGTYYFLGLILMTLGVVLYGGDVLRLLGLEKFTHAGVVAAIAAVGFMFHGLYLVPSTYLFLNELTRWIPIISFSGLIVTFAASALLAPSFGMYGAAMSLSAGFAATFLVAYIVRETFVPVFARYESKIWTAAGVVAAAAVTGIAIPFVAGWPAIWLKSAIVVAILSGGVWASGILVWASNDLRSRAASADG